MRRREDASEMAMLFSFVVFISTCLIIFLSFVLEFREIEKEELPVQMAAVRHISIETLPEVEVEEPVESTPEVVIEPIEVEEQIAYFDVPLDEDLQNHIFELCSQAGIDPSIIIAMIKTESDYNVNTVGDNGNSFGLMQVQPRFHQARMDKLGCEDLLNPYQNVAVGIDFLKELLGHGRGLEWALMAYNGGHAYANRYAESGRVSTYALKVMGISADLDA